MKQIGSYCLLLSFLLFAACGRDRAYVPQDLRKLSRAEVTELLINEDSVHPLEIVYRLPDGSVVHYDSLRHIPDPESYTLDTYVDNVGTIIEMVFRKITVKEKAQADKAKEKKTQAALDRVSSLPVVAIDCNDLIHILEEVHYADQDMRLNGGGYDPEKDMENLQIIISIIKTCGMPTIATTNEQSLATIWLVFQHSPHEFRKAYYPLLQEAAANGDIKARSMALMEDRLLMGEGKPQIYGSQLRGSGPNGSFELYKIKEPEYVNQRRAEVGLGPLEEYVSHWGLEFNVSQKEK